MIFGFNSEVRIGTSVYHVQTEDRGAPKHLIDTTVYMGGRLVHRRKTSYEELLNSPDFGEAVVRGRLEEQHRGVIEELRAGSLAIELPPPPPKPTKPARSAAAAAKPARVRAPAAPTIVSPPRGRSSVSARPGARGGAAQAAATAAPEEAAVQLVNPASWYAAGTATLKIDVKSSKTNQPLADVMLLAILHSPAGPITFAAKSDSQGCVELVFPLPHLGPAGAELVIKTPGRGADEIRYSLKPTDTSNA